MTELPHCFSRKSIGLLVVLLAGSLSAAQTSNSLGWLDPDGKPLPLSSYEEVEEFLRTAEIVSSKRVGEGMNNPLEVFLEKDGIRMHALFCDVHVERSQMPLSGGRTSYFFRDDAIFECAAYQLAKLLGLDTVPPAVGRRIRGQQGRLQAWVEGVWTEKALRKKTDVPPSGGINRWRWIMLRQNIYIFDT